MEVYLVGGAVRDRLLGLAVKERDYVVVGATPEELIIQGFKPVGKDFPVFLHPKTHEEYALARTERKKGVGYTGFSVCASKKVTLEEDLKRRDLTINAIAEKLSTNELIDPYHGLQDLERKRLRHVSEAFLEDPVRILRVGRFMARFASLGFQVAPDTLSLMYNMVQNKEVDALVSERIWREFEKAFSEANPEEFVITLEACGAWRHICPEWANVKDDQHQKALYTLKKACTLTTDTVIRFASLMQCMVQTPQAVASVETLTKRWRLPRTYRDLLQLSVYYKDKAHQVAKLSAAELLELLEQTDAIRRPERFKQFLIVCEASWTSDVALQKKVYPQKNILLEALKVIQSISVATLIEAKLEGEAFRDQLRNLRIQALKKHCYTS